MKKYCFTVVFLLMLSLSGCVTLGSDRAMLKQGVVQSKYDKIKTIVIEEASNNGFSNITSEIKPSKFNDWKGKLYFSLKTPNGTDQLTVEFNGDNVYMHGAGTRSNPDSAIKAIRARIEMI